MRPMRRSTQREQPGGEPTRARCDLERKWFRRMSPEPRLATLVTARSAAAEAYHRWIPYRQGFSPELVRMFLVEAGFRTGGAGGVAKASSAILDPFSGSGTVAVECARRGVPAVAVESLRTLIFVLSTMSSGPFPAMPDLPESDDWRDFAIALADPLHRAALMLSVARQFTGKGQPNRGAASVAHLLPTMTGMMREDLTFPLRSEFRLVRGDARRMSVIDDESISGVLTSPPYISRYDYSALTQPMEEVYSFWYGPDKEGETCSLVRAARENSGTNKYSRADCSITANLKAADRDSEIVQIDHLGEPGAPAAAELCAWLTILNRRRDAALVVNYLTDLALAVAELSRVLRSGAPCWMVVGGARIEGAHFPADLHVAELAEINGFKVEAILVARELVPNRRRLGDLGSVAPRESVLVLRRT